MYKGCKRELEFPLAAAVSYHAADRRRARVELEIEMNGVGAPEVYAPATG